MSITPKLATLLTILLASPCHGADPSFDWVKDRNDCWKTDDKHACATYAYRSRITELEITSGTLVVPEPVNYRCDGGPYDYLTAIFYRNTAMPAVVLTLSWVPGHDGQIIAFLQPGGSGARYSDGSSAFWEHHSEATLEANGEQSICKKQ